MPRTVTLPNGYPYYGVPDDEPYEAVLETGYREGKIDRPEYVEPSEPDQETPPATNPPEEQLNNIMADMISRPDYYPTAGSEEHSKEVGIDTGRVLGGAVSGIRQFVLDTYNNLGTPTSDEDIEIQKKRTVEIVTDVVGAFGHDPKDIIDEVTGKVMPTETVVGASLELAPYVVGPVLAAIAAPTIPLLAGAGTALIVDQILADPDSNVANAWADYLPESFQHEVIDYMAAEPDDSNARKRMKLLASGMSLEALMVLTGGLVKGTAWLTKRWLKPPKELTDKEIGESIVDYLDDAREAVSVSNPPKKAVRDPETGTIHFTVPEPTFTEAPQGADQIIRQNSSWLRRHFQQYTQSNGYFSPKAYNAFNDSQFAQRQNIAAAEHIGKRLHTAMQNITDVTENKAVAARVQRSWDEGLKFLKDVPEAKKAQAFADYHELPLDVSEELLSARGLIDDLSKKILNSNMVSPELKRIIKDNQGKYIRRSYRHYEDPGYTPNSLDRENAVHFLANKEMKKNPNLLYENALEQAEVQVKNILGEDSPEGAFRYFQSARKVNKALLSQKEDIPKEIRKLLGEIEDPSEQILLSVSKVSQMYETNNFYTNLNRLGTTGKYIFDEHNVPNPNIFSVQIKGTNSKLDGKYTTPEVFKAIQGVESQWLDPNSTGRISTLYKNFLSLKGASQASKTVYSHVTHLRNFLGGTQFGMANGANPFTKAGHAPFKVLANQIRQGGDKGFDAAYEKYLRLGIINTNVRVGEFRALLETGFESGVDDLLDNITRLGDKGLYYAGAGSKGFTRAKNLPNQVYVATDDFFKISNFAHEMDNLRLAHPKEALDVLEQEAARIVRDTFPNYDKVPKGIQRLRELPIGNFVAFPAEIMRTSTNIVRQASKEITSGNRVLRIRGEKRLAGFIASMGGWNALGTGTAHLAGMTDEEAEAAAVLTETPWSKDTPRNWVRIDGELYTNDSQFIDSYSFIKEPVLAAYHEIVSGSLHGDDLENFLVDATARAGKKLLNPFVSESILTKSVDDLLTAWSSDNGRTSEGKALFTDGLTKKEKTENFMVTLLGAFVPGSYNSLSNLKEAWDQNLHRTTGNTKSLGAELVTNMTGVRFTKFEPEDSLKFALGDYSKDVGNVLTLTPDYEKTGGDLVDRYLNINRSKYDLQRELYRKLKAAETILGPGRTIQIMKEKKFGDEAIGFLLSGKFKPDEPTDKHVVDLVTKTFSSKRKDIPEGEKAETTAQRLFSAWADMMATSLESFDEDSEEVEGSKERAESAGTRLLKAEGGLVAVPNAKAEPDERINPITGMAFNAQAGALLDDDADPLLRMGFAGGGIVKLIKTLGKKWHEAFKNADTTAALRASDSIAAHPVTPEDLKEKMVVSYMNNNRSIRKSRLDKKGTKDLGNFDEVIPLGSEEADMLLREGFLPTTEVGDNTHIIVQNIVQQSKGKSPTKLKAFLTTEQGALDYYSQGNRPLWTRKGKSATDEGATQWRSQDDADTYYSIPELQGTDAIASNLDMNPNTLETIKSFRILDEEDFNQVVQMLDPKVGEQASIPQKYIDFIEEHIVAVPKSIQRVIDTPPASPKEFLKGNHPIVKKTVFRVTGRGDESSRDLIMSGVNPREMGVHAASNTTQANTIANRNLTTYSPDTLNPVTPRISKAQVKDEFEREGRRAVDKKGSEVELEPFSMAEYYGSMKKPIIVNEDIGLWDANLIIDNMKAARVARQTPKLLTPKELKAFVKSDPNIWTEVLEGSVVQDKQVMEYTDAFARWRREPQKYESTLKAMGEELEEEGVDLNNLDYHLDKYYDEFDPSTSAFLEGLEDGLGRKLTEAEWERIEGIQTHDMVEVINQRLFDREDVDPITRLLSSANDHKVNKEFTAFLEDLEFDGVAYNNTGEASLKGEDTISYIFFNAEQLKAKNAIAFNPTDPRPLYNKGGEVKLEDYKDKNFVKRILDPKRDVIDNKDGSVGSHLMAADIVKGKNIAYPTIIENKKGELEKLSVEDAQKHAMKTGEFIEFKTLDEAIDWSINYKNNREGFQEGGEVAAPLVDAPLHGSKHKVVSPTAVPQRTRGALSLSLHRKLDAPEQIL